MENQDVYITNKKIKALESDKAQLLYEKGRMVQALQMCYQKHNGGDESIGWDELCEELSNVLPEVMGDKSFCVWLQTIP